ncbi:membrane-anchored junction protein isoform X2 [Rhinopithecus roxellana]|uniref:membrane-anchored junction protein isoform X2 n=1 Tax=Rhinopithecus roxellana TaxID=61622 RepID=UPI00123708AD|nr:membrane-anchored junction protein isoform X2 [Rhinopithecus roxellana]
MSLKPFTYPFPETRFLHAGPNVYKFKIRYGNSIREEEIENKEVIIQELEVPAEKKAVGAMMRKRKHMDEPSSPSRPGLDRAKIGTSSQGSSKKKPPVETRRNRERKTQQGLQETLASDITGVQKQDSEWGHSLPGPVVPSLQHNSPPPKERAASGFVGFLSSLFPFRYFFRKSSHS